ncbi:MAG: glycosyltransferase [Kiritimatiellae bacterium]|nr:glycosyltransferase [Kiritimatiellia bacterium]
MNPRIAFWFRYGLAEHAELFPALPGILHRLAEHAVVDYYGPRSVKPLPALPSRVRRCDLPWTVDRRSAGDKLLKTGRWLAALPRMARACRRNGTDAVWMDETVPFSASIALRHFGPRAAITVADLFLENYLGRYRIFRPLVRSVERLDIAAWRRMPLLFTRSDAARDWLVGEGCDPDRIVSVHDPCDLSLYTPGDRADARKRLRVPDDEIWVHFHGILHPNKGLDLALEGFARAAARDSRLRLRVVGDGPARRSLERFAASRGLTDRVRFEGYTEPAEVARDLPAADIGLVSRRGGRGDQLVITSVLGHYLACGIPVLAARLGGVAEVIRDGVEGHLYDPASADDFARQLAALAADPSARARMSAEGPVTAKRIYDMESAIRRTTDALLKLASGPSR